mgnify:CR=1 FL=1
MIGDIEGYRFILPRRALRGGSGSHLGLSAGESLEFQDYRDYTPGDDLRNLDWNVLARTDREVIRVRREEIAPVVEIFRDRSESMSFPIAKSDTADFLVRLITAAAPTCKVVERKHPQTPRAVRVLISDLLNPEEPALYLSRIAHQASAVIILRVLAREERSPEKGTFELIDSETLERREMKIDDATYTAYLDALAAHTSRWQSAANRQGATFVDLTAEDNHLLIIEALCRHGLLEVRA